MVLCGKDFSCGGCMDVDNKDAKQNITSNPPVDSSGQLTQPMRRDVQNMISNAKSKQWANQETYPNDAHVAGNYRQL